jgi:hypothetical protein
MIEWELAYDLTDDQAEVLNREIIAIIVFLLCRKKSGLTRKCGTRRESAISSVIFLAAVVESLAFFIAYTSLKDDDRTAEQLLETLTCVLKQSVRHIRAAGAADQLIARLQAKQKRNRRRKSTRNPD